MSESPAEAEVPAANDASAPSTPGRMAYLPLCATVMLTGIAVDQLVKLWAQRALMATADHPGRIITIIPGFFDLTYATNTGAAFSFADGHVGPLAIVSAISTIAFSVFWWYLPAKERVGRVAIALILSGAIGNLIDRVSRGYVVDMFHAFWREWHYPIFNVADTFICIGAAVMAWLLFKGRI